MTALAEQCAANVYEREISRFLREATGRRNKFLTADRRGARRYHRSMPIFITRLDGHPKEDLSVTLDDISVSGIGFFSDIGFPVGAILSVKLFWSDPHATRVPAVVRHTEITQQGMHVGAEFIVSDNRACELIETTPASWYG